MSNSNNNNNNNNNLSAVEKARADHLREVTKARMKVLIKVADLAPKERVSFLIEISKRSKIKFENSLCNSLISLNQILVFYFMFFLLFCKVRLCLFII